MLEHAFDAGIHFVFLKEFAPLSRRDSSFNRLKKSTLFVQIARYDLLHQFIGITALLSGAVGKFGLKLGSEMDFHVLQSRSNAAWRQRGVTVRSTPIQINALALSRGTYCRSTLILPAFLRAAARS
jgi:hypothetical protein